MLFAVVVDQCQKTLAQMIFLNVVDDVKVVESSISSLLLFAALFVPPLTPCRNYPEDFL